MGPTSPLPFCRTLSVFGVPLSSPYFPVQDTGLRCGNFFCYADLQGGIQVPGADSLTRYRQISFRVTDKWARVHSLKEIILLSCVLVIISSNR